MNKLIQILSQKAQKINKAIFLLLAGIFPVITSVILVCMHYNALQNKASLLKTTKQAFFYNLDKRIERHQFLQEYLGADSSYLQHHMQFPLNASYLAKLRSAVNTEPFSIDPRIQQQYQHLSAQTLHFHKKPLYQSSLLKETIFSIENPIFVTSDSLHQILALIEGTTIDNYSPKPKRPQIFFTHLKIKKQTPGLYQCHIELLQREFYKKGAS